MGGTEFLDDGSGAAPFCALPLWSLAAFRTTSFVLGTMLWLHARGSLLSSLQQLDTLSGFVLFVVLWTTTWLASRRGLKELGAAPPSAGAMVMITTVAGAWNGLYLFAVLLAVFLVIRIGSLGATVAPALIFGAAFGGPLAFTIGAVAGLAYGLLEALLSTVTRRLYRLTVGSG